MARTGKIARLPRDIRAQLNTRLQDGHEAKTILPWLNSLPQAKHLLADDFGGRPVTESNLSDWRQGGYQEWLAHQDLLLHARELADNRTELETATHGRSLGDHLADALSFRFAAFLAVQGTEFDDSSRQQLRVLGRLCQAVVKLRRSEQNAARLKIETQRWELARRKIEEDKADADKRKLKEALAAPVWAALKKGKRVVKFGAGKAARFAADYLEEIEKCQDPAHFESKVLSTANLEEMQRYGEELAKKPLVQRTPMQAAIEMDQEMEAYLEARKARREARAARKQPKAARPAKPPQNPSPVPQVHPVHSVHPVHEPAPLPTPPQSPIPQLAAPEPSEGGSPILNEQPGRA